LPLLVEKRQLVTPGDLIAEGEYRAGENTYERDGKIYATKIGAFDSRDNTVYVIALKGFYIPETDDLVIGKVIDISLSGWIVDINAPYNAMLFVSEVFERSFNPRKDELTEVFDVGGMLLAKVAAFDRTRDPVLTLRGPGLGKITHGRIVEITPTKIPRLIGKKGSMIDLVKKGTGCQIVVGKNGLVLIRGKKPEDEASAIKIIRIIEEEAHTSGLTNRIGELIKKLKNEVEISVQDKGKTDR
jgi:exosome complex component RRP4